MISKKQIYFRLINSIRWYIIKVLYFKNPKNYPKNVWKLNCQTIICIVSEFYLEKSRLCGFKVEMGEARLRALTHINFKSFLHSYNCRNGRSPTKGIDTMIAITFMIFVIFVEMGGARLRALTHILFLLAIKSDSCRRNGRSPTKGIDTLHLAICYNKHREG